LEIGDYTVITEGTIILTHDYSLSTLRRVYGEWIGEGLPVIIGNNCFVGMNSILLMGTELGNNVIVGAESVVHGKYPDDVVIAGNSAKVICSLDEYYKKRCLRTKKEAIICAKRFYDRMGRRPVPLEFAGFKFLYAPREKDYLNKNHLEFKCSADESNEIEDSFFKTKPIWNGFDEFLDEALCDKEEH
jgi:hypothetical protein